MVQNPPWVTDVIARSYDTLQRHAPRWLPRVSNIKHLHGPAVRGEIQEYGCGAYGCVLPTIDDNVVMKVTTDDTEAQFAAHLSHTLVVPICVTYHMVMQLPDESHKGRPMFFLWREAAELVGELPLESENPARAYKLIDQQHKFAQDAYADLHAGSSRMHGSLEKWLSACEAMRSEPLMDELGAGMVRLFQEQRIFFGDVHAGNLGRVMRHGVNHWVITDPGHIAVIDM